MQAGRGSGGPGCRAAVTRLKTGCNGRPLSCGLHDLQEDPPMQFLTDMIDRYFQDDWVVIWLLDSI